jgi:hypothetical protein
VNHSTSLKKLLIILSVAIAFLVILAITLHVAIENKNKLQQNNKIDKTEISIESLAYAPVDSDVFYESLKESNIEPIDLSAYKASDYLLCTYEGTTKGGAIFFKDEDKTYLSVSFYDSSVEMNDEYTLQYTANGVEVHYDTQIVDNGFETNAYAEYNNLKYMIYYISEENDCTNIFNEIFS